MWNWAAGLVALLVLIPGCDALNGALGLGEEPPEPKRALPPVERPVSPPRRVPPPRSDSPIELAVGQWTRHKIRYSNGRESELTYQIVDAARGGYWIEVINGPPAAGTVVQVLTRVRDRENLQSAQIVAARVRMPNGFVKQVPDELMPAVKESYRRSVAELFFPEWKGKLSPVTLHVPAGTFEGCLRSPSLTYFTGAEVEGTVYHHTDVPISALVKSETKDGGAVMELLDYGLTGAVSVLGTGATSPSQ